MPLVGFTCPSWVPTAGEQHSIDYCLGSCPHQCAAAPLLAAVYDANQTNYHVGAYISASMLAGRACKRKVQYERFEPYFETIRNVWWPFRGTIIHALLEKKQDLLASYGWLQELKLSTKLVFEEYAAPIFDTNGMFTGAYDDQQPLVIQVNGTTDLYNPWEEVMGDMKSMACGKAAKFVQGHQEESWERQLNVYAWLVTKTPISDEIHALAKRFNLPRLKGKFLPAPKRLFIQGVSMLELPQTGSTYQPMRDPNIHDVPEIKVWDPAHTEAWVRPAALEWFDTLVLRLPQPVVAKSERWMCRSCCFNGEKIKGERCFPNASHTPAPAAVV